MHRSVERSLRLPGVDRLQICSLYDHEHIGFTAAMAPGDPVEVLRQLQETGVIQHLGVAGSPIKMTMQHQEAVPFWEICQPHGVAALIAAPYGSGILAKVPGAYSRYMYNPAPESYVRHAFALEALCQTYGVPLAAVALQFSLRNPRITSTILGISKPERLQETLRLAQQPIPETLWERIDEAPPA